MMKNRYWLILLLMAVLLASCASQTASSQQQDAGRLVIYSGRSESLVAPIIEQFSQVSGVKVEIRYGNTSELAATLLEEGKNSPADIFYAQDPGSLGAIANAGLLAALPEDTIAKVESRFRSSEGLWVGISGRVRVVVYNTQRLKPEDLPEDLFGFTDPRWKGKIGWAPTNASFQAMVTAMRKEWGEEKTKAWLDGILANQPVIFEGNTPIVAAVGSGEIEVGYVNHYYLYRFLKEQGEAFPARNHFMNNGGPDSLVMVSGIGRLASGKNEENALKFINFLLSPIAQQYFAGQTYEYPLVEGVQTMADLPPLESLNAADLTAEQLADLEGTLNLLRASGVLP